jgi:hypothetical protein
MRLLVTHLTRMRVGFVCVAGMVPSTGAHVRPVVPGRRLRRAEIEIGGSEIVIGTELDLGAVTPVPSPPEVEDHAFVPGVARRIRDWPPTDLAPFLHTYAASSLEVIFGSSLEPDGATASMAIGAGTASLGCLAPTDQPTISVDAYDKVKLALEDGGNTFSVTVADLRLYEADQKTPDAAAIRRLQAELEGESEVFLAVGLSRPFAKSGGAPRHWLQINNVHVFTK